ncbi:hypothetical protein [Apibacter adventoris]|uniref:Uncharacterized protein n=1 Tax=Apibacter adventoris TaxID=1679466 RepID=A0A2S8A7K1_9FLAO|nr:hypothetical protein [Apibacter adventoris]PQL90539.1 hypothetical protein C4S77_11690 [Apibacter adventoris]
MIIIEVLSNIESPCEEKPCFRYAKLGMSEKEVIKEFGYPELITYNKEEIVEDLKDLKNTYNKFIQEYKKSEKKFVEDRLDNINKILNNINNSNLKKCRYIIKVPKENYEYYKTIYYLNSELIVF